MTNCEKEEHVHAWHDDAVGIRTEKLADQIIEELKTCCSDARRTDIADWIIFRIKGKVK